MGLKRGYFTKPELAQFMLEASGIFEQLLLE